MTPRLLGLLISLATAAGPPEAAADPTAIDGYVDLHIHLAAHLAVPVYGRGPDAERPAELGHRHALRPQIFTADLQASEAAIYVSLAYANPFFTDFESRRSMRARIERQLAYVEAYVARHAERFGLARTPTEARAIVASGRTAIVHGIEGSTKLLDNASDARSLAQRGVAVITPVHLADNPLGGAWCQSGSLLVLNVPGCWRQALGPAGHGLTERGLARIGDLIDAGIVVDLAHLAPAAFDEAAALLGARGVAPVYTHVTAAAIHPNPSALSDDRLRVLTALGGLTGIAGHYSHIATAPADYCAGSIDDLRQEWDHLVAVTAGPVAWGSDFQGGVDHLRPKYGPHGCAPTRPDGAALDAFDVQGLAHPGLVGPMFDHLARDGADRAPLDASAERFVRIWELARGERTSVTD